MRKVYRIIDGGAFLSMSYAYVLISFIFSYYELYFMGLLPSQKPDQELYLSRIYPEKCERISSCLRHIPRVDFTLFLGTDSVGKSIYIYNHPL